MQFNTHSAGQLVVIVTVTIFIVMCFRKKSQGQSRDQKARTQDIAPVGDAKKEGYFPITVSCFPFRILCSINRLKEWQGEI